MQTVICIEVENKGSDFPCLGAILVQQDILDPSGPPCNQVWAIGKPPPSLQKIKVSTNHRAGI